MTVSTSDERLGAILGAMTDDLRQGRSPDVAALAREHPDLAQDLQTLWAAVLVAEGVAAEGLSGEVVEAPPLTVSQPGGRLCGAAAPRPHLPRTFGDYELLEELGRGGMGVVYRARQVSLGRIVALKLMLRGELATADDLARFRSEAQAAARLDHPHIVRVLEVGEHAGQPYFTMQYIGGTTLSRRLADGPLPPREAAELLLPVCQAIDFAHGQGVLHRDLKPSNILIDEQGRPHVSDFGLAKRVEGDARLTRTGAILGTPAYMPPEQAAGARGKLTPASDVYSLGAILYQMLTGRPPLEAASPMDTLLLVLEQEPLPPRLVNPRADRELELMAVKCLQKPPELRYASAAALARDLQAYLADEPISARSGVFVQVVARWFRETHQATVLEHWGLLWMWHSLVLLVISLATNGLQWGGVTSRLPYLGLWIAGLGTWAAMFWSLRRRGGPVTFVERQIAHVWAASMASIMLLFVVEMLLRLDVLTLSPVLAISSGMVFLVKAGMLSGRFYVQAAALFATAVAMAALQRWEIPLGISLFGLVSALCFFVPGWKYYRQCRTGS